MATDITKRFENVSAFALYIEQGKCQEGFTPSRLRRDNEGWAGTRDFDDANKRLHFGDKELFAKVSNNKEFAKAKKAIEITRAKRQTYASVVGFAPHVPNFVAGVPTSMLAQKSTSSKRKTVTICYCPAASFDTSAEDLERCALNVFLCIMSLEAQGTRVNLWIGIGSQESKQNVSAFVNVKRAEEKLDVLRAVYPCISPSFLRRHFLAFVEQEPGVKSSFSWGYGHPMTSAEIKKSAQSVGVRANVTLTVSDVMSKTRDEVAQMIAEAK